MGYHLENRWKLEDICLNSHYPTLNSDKNDLGNMKPKKKKKKSCRKVRLKCRKLKFFCLEKCQIGFI